MSNEIVPRMSNVKNSFIPKMCKKENKSKKEKQNAIFNENIILYIYMFFIIVDNKQYNLFVFTRF